MDLTRRAQQFLQDHQVLTLAVTVAGDGPHAAAVFYAPAADFHLYFLTAPTTRHGAALLANPLVAGTIQRDRQDSQVLQGLQVRGRCHRLAGAPRNRAWAIYTARFPFLKPPARGAVARLVAALGRIDLWRLEIDWLRLIDNRQGFGHKEEWTRG